MARQSGSAAQAAAYDQAARARMSGPAVRAAATSWLVVAILGQLLFAANVVGWYGRTAAHGRIGLLNAALARGAAADPLGNLALASHLAITLAAGLGGAVRLLLQQPPIVALALVQYLLPLAGLELYFRAQDGGGPRTRIAVAAGLAALMIVAAGGIAATAVVPWPPHR